MPAVTRAPSLFEDVPPAAIFQTLERTIDSRSVGDELARLPSRRLTGDSTQTTLKTSLGERVFPP